MKWLKLIMSRKSTKLGKISSFDFGFDLLIFGSWAFLEIHTNASSSNIDQVLAAGYLEGSITADLIYMAWYNNIKGYCDGRKDFCVRLYWYLKDNVEWMGQNVKKFGDSDEYWHQVDYKIYLKIIIMLIT